ncbi:MAG: hypothetical protein ACKOWG_21020, partial [Planctomycetia bacterium]
MSQIMHTLRFVVGMAMLAGGAVLAEPFVSAVLDARRAAGPAGAMAPADQRSTSPALAIGAAVTYGLLPRSSRSRSKIT